MEDLLSNPVFLGGAAAIVYLLMQGLKRLGWITDETTNRAQTLVTGLISGLIALGWSLYTGEFQVDFGQGVIEGLSMLVAEAGAIWGLATLAYHRLKDYFES